MSYYHNEYLDADPALMRHSNVDLNASINSTSSTGTSSSKAVLVINKTSITFEILLL